MDYMEELSQGKLKDIAGNNNWRTSTFEKRPYFSALFDNGVVEKGGPKMTSIMEQKDLQDIAKLGYKKFTDVPYNIVMAGGNTINISESEGYSVYLKTNVINNWIKISTLELIYYDDDSAFLEIADKLSKKMYINISDIISSICNSLSSIDSLVVGDYSRPFSEDLLNELLEKKEDLFIKNIAGVFMHSSTFYKIDKEWKSLLAQKHVVPKSFFDIRDSNSFFFNSETRAAGLPIYLDNKLPAGDVFLIERGAFQYCAKELSNSKGDSVLEYAFDRTTDNGFGTNFYILNQKFIIHPKMFSFAGVLGKHYKIPHGLSVEEWSKNGIFNFVGEVKRSPILIMKIKMDDDYSYFNKAD